MSLPAAMNFVLLGQHPNELGIKRQDARKINEPQKCGEGEREGIGKAEKRAKYVSTRQQKTS